MEIFVHPKPHSEAWGLNRMHPVQLFELVFIMLLAILVLHWIARSSIVSSRSSAIACSLIKAKASLSSAHQKRRKVLADLAMTYLND